MEEVIVRYKLPHQPGIKILLFGATGNIGQRILTEALGRRYFVTAASRQGRAI